MMDNSPILSAERPSLAPMALSAVATVALVAALGVVFFATPNEATMGVVQKIFYFHVPSAMAAYAGFIICGVASVYYLVTGNVRGDIAARSAAEIGVLFCAAVLLSGPLWAKKAWGTYWTGEPRLLLTLVTALIFVAYLVVRSVGGRNEMTRKICAVLGILGVANIPLVRMSVEKWRGNHPQVVTGGGDGIAEQMVPAFASMSIAILLVFAALFVIRLHIGYATEDAETWHRLVARRRDALRDLAPQPS